MRPILLLTSPFDSSSVPIFFSLGLCEMSRGRLHPDNDPNLLRSQQQWSGWKFRVIIKLRAENLYRNALGENHRSASEDQAALNWDRADDKEMNIVCDLLHSDVIAQVTEAETLRDLWVILTGLFKLRNDGHMHTVQQRYFEYKYEDGMQMRQCIGKIKALADDCRNVGIEVDDTSLMTKILGGLPSIFESVSANFNSKPRAQRTMADLTALLLLKEEFHEQRKPAAAAVAASSSTDKKEDKREESVALSHQIRDRNTGRSAGRGQFGGAGRGQYQNVGRNFNHPQDNRFRGICKNCGVRGHRAADCRNGGSDGRRFDNRGGRISA